MSDETKNGAMQVTMRTKDRFSLNIHRGSCDLYVMLKFLLGVPGTSCIQLHRGLLSAMASLLAPVNLAFFAIELPNQKRCSNY